MTKPPNYSAYADEDTPTIGDPDLVYNSAFAKYLCNIPVAQAYDHILECLRSEPQDSIAWDLMAEVHGPNWSAKPEDMPKLILACIQYVSTDLEVDDETD